LACLSLLFCSSGGEHASEYRIGPRVNKHSGGRLIVNTRRYIFHPPSASWPRGATTRIILLLRFRPTELHGCSRPPANDD
jgi:hypothetical protein